MRSLRLIALLTTVFATMLCAGQDTFKTGTNLGVERVRIAVADFKDNGAAAQYLSTFDKTLFNDLNNSGILDVVSKSFNPTQKPSSPSDVQLNAWGNAPVNAAMLAFGNATANNGRLVVDGWLFDTKNTQNPQVLGKHYDETASDDSARTIAHRFADEIVFRLGGGIAGIFESKIYFISARSGSKQVWAMDYDGENQHQVTHLGSGNIALSPRVSPDGTKLAFTELGTNGAQIAMWSIDLNRKLSMPRLGGTNSSPAWSPDGGKIAFSSSMTGDPEIYTMPADGGKPQRITAYRGPDVAPAFNPKTGSQIAWVTGRSGLPQIYTMESDGTNTVQMTDSGYAVSPSWSPNGGFLAFAWIRHYGPGAPGAQDIYVMDVASKGFVQLTNHQGRNDYPSWSPDNRHIVFQRDGNIWTMLADGTQAHPLTNSGRDSQPNWSWH